MFIFLLLFSSCIFSMERSLSNMPSAIATYNHSDSISSSLDSFASPEERDELYARAIHTVYPMGYDDINERLSSCLDKVITNSNHAPNENDDDISESNIATLRRLRSGDIQQHHEQSIKRLVMMATSKAFADQEIKIEEQKAQFDHQKIKTESKFSKSSTVIIALLSSIITSVASVLVAVYSQK